MGNLLPKSKDEKKGHKDQRPPPPSYYFKNEYESYSSEPWRPQPLPTIRHPSIHSRHPLGETSFTSSGSEKQSQQNELNRSFGGSNNGPQTMVHSSTTSVQRSVHTVPSIDHRPTAPLIRKNLFISFDQFLINRDAPTSKGPAPLYIFVSKNIFLASFGTEVYEVKLLELDDAEYSLLKKQQNLHISMNDYSIETEGDRAFLARNRKPHAINRIFHPAQIWPPGKENVSMVSPSPKVGPTTGQKPLPAPRNKASSISMAQKPNTQPQLLMATTNNNVLRRPTPAPPIVCNSKTASTQKALNKSSLTATFAKLSVNDVQAKIGSPKKTESNRNHVVSKNLPGGRLTLHWVTDKLTARFNNQEFNVNYLDLYNDEYAFLQKNLSIDIVITADDVIVSGDELTLQRLNVPTKTSPTDFSPIETKTNTQTIFFSNFNNPLIGKYQGNYYFIYGRLVTEYIALLKATGYPLGIAMRLNTNRIIENKATRSLDVTKATVFESDQDILVVEAFDNSDTKWIAPPLKKANLHRFLYDPLKRREHSLMLLPDYLVYAENGSVDEVYAEVDYFDEEIDEDIEEKILKQEFMSGFNRQRTLRFSPVKEYLVSEPISEVVLHEKNNKSPLSDAGKNHWDFITGFQSIGGLQQNIYADSLQMMIQIEDETERLEMKSYYQTNCEVVDGDAPLIYEATINLNPEVIETFGQAISDKKFYSVVLKASTQTILSQTEERSKRDSRLQGCVLRLANNKLIIEMDKKLKHTGPTYLYNISFLHTRLPYLMSQQALEDVKKRNLLPYLFPVGPFLPPIAKTDFQQREWFDDSLNPEQMTAVCNIIDKSSRPYPFILFGPPGTGKTKTLVEAIAQIATDSEQNILVCSTSNAACDVLASRLLKIIPNALIYRMYSATANVDNIEDDIRASSNVNDGDAFYPSMVNLKEVQILICTSIVAGRLMQANINKRYPNHFSYIFIDECACSTESSALIPITVSSRNGALAGNVILAGDPSQLRNIIKSELASKMGYDISLMERLMTSEPYQRNPNTKDFNNRYIVQLVQNYRSHPAILHTSNKLYYELKLVARASQETVNWYLNTSILPSPQFPILFKSVQGNPKRGNTTSFYNNEELTEVLNFVRHLLNGSCGGKGKQRKQSQFKTPMPEITADDIGIVSPYKKQTRNIVNALKHQKLGDVKVGSVEVFQGQEKPVIIVTTVRSKMNNVGFLSNWRRLNVLMTRAKCLLIFVGDPFTLQCDPDWAEVLRYLQKNNAIIQSNNRFLI